MNNHKLILQKHSMFYDRKFDCKTKNLSVYLLKITIEGGKKN